MLKQKYVPQEQSQEIKAEEQFILKRQIKKKEAQMLIFLYNADFQLTFEKFDEKISLYTQLKKYKNKIVLKNEQVKRQFHALSQKLHQKVIREDPQCQKELNRLQTSWEIKKIDYFHRFYVQRSICSTYLKHVNLLIKNQQHLIKHQQHIYFSILRSIWARQICLGQIQKNLKSLQPSDMYQHFHVVKERQIQRNRRMQQKTYKIHGFRAKLRLDQKQINLHKTKIQRLFEQIQNYRQLTYHLIELIRNWKLYIISLTHDVKIRKEKLSFYYQEHNILLSILNDTSFIFTSFLSNFFNFSLKNDPFLLKPIFYLQKKEETHKYLNAQEQQLKKLINIKPMYINNIVSSIRQLYYQLLSYSSIRLTDRSSHIKVQHLQSQKQLIFNKQDLKIIHQQQISKIKNTMRRYQSQAFKKNHLIKKQSIDKNIQNVDKMKSYKSQKIINLRAIKQNNRQISQKDSLQSFIKNKSSIVNKTQKIKFTPMSTFYQPKPKGSNPQQKMFQFDEIKKLKEQVYNKVKQQLQYETRKQILQSNKFHEMIDNEIKGKMLKLLDEENDKVLRQHLQITALSFSEQQIKSYIAYAYKQISSLYTSMQIDQNDLMKKITQISYCYILKVHNKYGDCANIIATINRQVLDYKSIQIELISFKYKQMLQKIILKVIQFFWKYQNCKEIIIQFNVKINCQDQQQLIQLLRSKLALNCNIIQKKYKNFINYKFIFIRNHLSQDKRIFNVYPQQIFFQIYAMLCTQPVELTANNHHSLQKRLYYDFIILEILRKYTNSEDFLTLRSSFGNKHRFWHLINQIGIVEDIQNEKVNVECIQAQNINELNYKLRLIKKPSLEVTDINTFNSIRMIQIQYSLTIAYQLKVLANENGVKYHRYAIRDNLNFMMDDYKTQFYKLPVKELKHLNIIIFSANNYFKHYSLGLNMYLLDILQQNKKKWTKRFTQNLWIEMLRFPSNGTQRQLHNLNTSRCSQFTSIEKDLLIGDRFQWFTDIQIQNGIQYRFKEGDVYLKKPLGIGVVTNKNILIYARIIGQDGNT